MSTAPTRAPMPTIKITHLKRVIKSITKKIRAGDMLTREELKAIAILGLPGWGKTEIPLSWFEPNARACIPCPELLAEDMTAKAIIEKKILNLILPQIEKLLDKAEANPLVPHVLMWDEGAQASTEVGKLICGYVQAREINGREIPSNVVQILTGNQRKHQAGVGSTMSHLVSRFRVYNIEPDVDGWLDWGATILHTEVLAYVHMKPTASYCWADDASEEAMSQMYRDASRDWLPFPSARSWTALSYALHADPEVGVEDFASFVGPERASEFNAMRGIQMPSHADLLEGRAEFPEKPMAKWVAVIRCGQMLTPGNASKTAKLLKSLNPELVEVGLKICGKTAIRYLKNKNIQVANGHMALGHYDSTSGASYFPGFAEELLAPGSRYLAMMEAK